MRKQEPHHGWREDGRVQQRPIEHLDAHAARESIAARDIGMGARRIAGVPAYEIAY
jgi:hypothetical protein